MIDALARRLGLNITRENFQVRAEQIRTLVQAYPSMIAANMVMAPLVAWLMWDKTEHSALVIWVALLYVFHALVAVGMVNLLQGLGAEVRLFHNAEEALRHPDIANADCFIVDYALGGELTGLNFLVAVQQRQQTPLCAVVVTGETSSQFISSVADSPWPVLHKPINYAKLLSSLRL